MSSTLAEPAVDRIGIRRVAWGLTAASGGSYLLGLATMPHHVWPNLLLMCFYLFGIGLAGVLFLALNRVMGAWWSDAIRPVPVAMARTVPVAAVMLGVVVLVGISNYPWRHGDIEHGASFWFKNGWLDPLLFQVRTVAYLVLFSVFALVLSRRPASCRSSSSVPSALFLVVFAVVFSLAGVDWIMSLNPNWFSTMWGVYQFSGILLSGLAVITFVSVGLHRLGPWHQTLTQNHLRDLGILTFSFSSFWMYIWFSQYMLIWYSNLPEETFYFADRVRGAWGPLFVANIFLNWAVPFAVLLFRPAKRSATVMLRIAVVILIGRWLDLYLMILPSERVPQPMFGFCEVGSMLGTIGLFGLMMSYSLRRDGILVE